MDPNQTPEQVQHLMMAIIPTLILIGIILVAIVIVPIWRILTRFGLGGALSLLLLIPWLGPIILLYIAAFSPWRIDATLVTGPYPPPYPQYPPQPPAPGPYAPVAYPQQAVPHPHAQHPVESFPAAGYPPPPPPVD
jgi:hypothetical protein